MLSVFSENVISTKHRVFHVFRCPKLTRESVWVLQKSHNAPKFNLYYEYAEYLIAVCFQIFPKVS